MDKLKKKIERMREHFEMMGYDVNVLADLECLVVSLSTNNSYRANRRVSFDELDKDFVVERAVRDLNELIIRDL